MSMIIGDHSATAAVPAASLAPAIRRQEMQQGLCSLTLLAAEIAASGMAVLLAAAIANAVLGGIPPSSRGTRFPVPFDLVALFAAIIGYLMFKGRYSQRIPFWTEARLVVSATLWALAIEILYLRLAAPAGIDWLTLAALLLFPALATTANRIAKRLLRNAGLWLWPVVIIGNGQTGMEAERALESDRSLGYQFVARIDPAQFMAESATMRLWPLLNRHRARSLLIALDFDGDQQRRIIECALHEQVPFSVVPSPRAFPAFSGDSTCLFGHDAMLLSFRNRLSSPVSKSLKATIDVLGAAVLLVLLCPLFLVLAISIRIDGGSIFFAHRRVGAQGQLFRCLKFRTMVTDNEHVLQEALARDPALAAEWHATRKLARDPRVTRIGQFLRTTSLDELPQLFNVLRLEMSLVGPRPIVESEIPLYGEHIAHYYATRPGMTGLWQVSGRSNTSYARRVQLDVWYVNNWSVWNDVAVLLKTIPAVMSREGAC